jgi:hypothetical protein
MNIEIKNIEFKKKLDLNRKELTLKVFKDNNLMENLKNAYLELLNSTSNNEEKKILIDEFIIDYELTKTYIR